MILLNFPGGTWHQGYLITLDVALIFVIFLTNFCNFPADSPCNPGDSKDLLGPLQAVSSRSLRSWKASSKCLNLFPYIEELSMASENQVQTCLQPCSMCNLSPIEIWYQTRQDIAEARAVRRSVYEASIWCLRR